MVLMSPVVELVIKATNLPFSVLADSGLALTTSAVRGGKMTDLRYFLAGRDVLAMFHNTDKHGVMFSLRLLPGSWLFNLTKENNHYIYEVTTICFSLTCLQDIP